MTATRPAAVAGSVLICPIRAGCATCSPDILPGRLVGRDGGRGANWARHFTTKLIVVPHAGYDYSGDVAALAYAPLARWRGRITRVVLLGPVHRVPVRALAAPTVGDLRDPVGPGAHRPPAAMAALHRLPRWPWTDLPACAGAFA